MSTVFHRGVPWLDRALDAALTRGIADEVTALADDYREGSGGFTAVESPASSGRVRASRDGISAILNPYGVVIGFVDRFPEAHTPSRPSPTGKTARGASSPTRKAKKATRGPRSYAELVEWLREEGYDVRTTGSGHLGVFTAGGGRVGTIASTASDHRSLTNDISDMRRVGAKLRKDHR